MLARVLSVQPTSGLETGDINPAARRVRMWALAALAACFGLLLVGLLENVAWGQEDQFNSRPTAFDDEMYDAPHNESMLVWLFNALGIRYIMLFFFLTVIAGVFSLLSLIFTILGVTCPGSLVQEIRGLLSQRRCADVAGLVTQRSSYLAKLLRTGLKSANSFHAWSIMQKAQAYEQAKVRNCLRSLGFMAILFFLAGTLGCVDGLVVSFSIIAKSSTAPKPSELSTGFSMSLVAPLVGYTLAWWTFIGYWILRNCYERFAARANLIAEELLGEYYTAAAGQ